MIRSRQYVSPTFDFLSDFVETLSLVMTGPNSLPERAEFGEVRTRAGVHSEHAAAEERSDVESPAPIK